MLQPKKTKYRRQQKGRMKGNAQRGHELAFGSFAIKGLENAWITGRQLEAARQAVTRYMKREGQIWIRIFPDKPMKFIIFFFFYEIFCLTHSATLSLLFVFFKLLIKVKLFKLFKFLI